VLQKATVSLDAAGALLELLVRAADAQGKLKAALDDARHQRQRAVANATHVLREMRETCYYNLVLWDLVLGTEHGTEE